MGVISRIKKNHDWLQGVIDARYILHVIISTVILVYHMLITWCAMLSLKENM